MDTDDLSKEAYHGILIEAERFNHDLTLQFGVLAASCKNEKEYLKSAKELISDIKNLHTSELSELFFGLPPNKIKLNEALSKILDNIVEVEKTPMEKRHFDF